MSNSPPPPTENGGASNAPGVRSRAAPLSGTWRMWARVGSTHAFQWRNIRLEITRAFVGSFSAAAFFCSVHSGSTPQSG
jgi:hypothetical protein